MYNIRPTTKFQKDLKRVKKRGFDISLLTDIIKKLAAGEPLPEKNRDHQLSGDYAGCRECHITPDWLLIYEVDGEPTGPGCWYISTPGFEGVCPVGLFVKV